MHYTIPRTFLIALVHQNIEPFEQPNLHSRGVEAAVSISSYCMVTVSASALTADDERPGHHVVVHVGLRTPRAREGHDRHGDGLAAVDAGARLRAREPRRVNEGVLYNSVSYKGVAKYKGALR